MDMGAIRPNRYPIRPTYVTTQGMSIWHKQARVSRQLLAWAGLSIGAGLPLSRRDDPLWRAIGVQAVAWGAIDGAIALAGLRGSRRRRAALPDPDAPAVLARETRTLRRLLWLNAGLDVLYVLGGLRLAQRDETWRGHGWGIVIQGAFLLLFDSWHAMTLPPLTAQDAAGAGRAVPDG